MRLIWLQPTSIVALLVALVAIAAPASGSSTCSGGRTLVLGASVRVYSSTTPHPAGTFAQTSVYACTFARGRPLLLGTTAGQRHVEDFVVAGDSVAFAATSMGVDTLSSSVEVLDAADDRLLRDLAAAGPSRRPESFTTVAAIVVRAAGQVGWIATVSAIGQRRARYEVHRAGSSGAALLDSGARIDPRSLRLRGERISWRDGAGTRSATLS